MTTDDLPLQDKPQTGTRDPAILGELLTKWLEQQHPGAAVTNLVVPQSNGMSSETLLATVTWPEDGTTHTEECVIRNTPDPAAVPVFPVYDMAKQFTVIKLVGEKSAVPVPRTLWLETDPAAIGSPFMVMSRVDGIVPPDVMPYTFGSWLSEAAPEDQQKLADSTIQVLADLHAIDALTPDFAFLELDRPGDTHLRRTVNDWKAYLEWICADGMRQPLLDQMFAWLDERWPVDEGATVISWGDSRIGNVIYRDFTPVAVLDWEMVALGPREIDLAWLIWMHRQFQEYGAMANLPGMPDFLKADDVVATYERLSGHTVRDLEWYLVFAALRYGVVMARVARRQLHFGERPMPDDPDDLLANRGPLEAMLAGSYW